MVRKTHEHFNTAIIKQKTDFLILYIINFCNIILIFATASHMTAGQICLLCTRECNEDFKKLTKVLFFLCIALNLI